MKHLQKFLMSAVLMSTVSAIAQAPAAGAPAAPPRPPAMALTSPAFEDGGVIPNKYTQAATGTAVSPKLEWVNVPAGTVSFALILHDPDTSLQKTTDQVLHWMIFNIPGTAHELPEGVPSGQATLPDGSIQAVNRGKSVGYMGMGAGANGPFHHYTFELYALDTKLSLGPDATQKDVETAMSGHIIGKAVVEGRFHRQS